MLKLLSATLSARLSGATVTEPFLPVAQYWTNVMANARGPAGYSFEFTHDDAYRDWIARFDVIDEQERALIDAELARLGARPKFMIVPLCAMNAAPRAVAAFREALGAQIYDNWACASAASNSSPAGALADAANSDADYILPLPIDARLSSSALCEFVFAIAERPDVTLLYGDEDALIDGKRAAPRFKTGYDSYLMLGQNLVGAPACFRRTVLLEAQAASLAATTVDNLLHELVLRIEALAGATRIAHIAAILCHRTATTDWSGATGRDVVRTHLAAQRRDFEDVTPAPLAPQWSRVTWHLPQPAPLVSIIVPTRDRPELLRVCADAVLNRTDYPAFELLIVDNGTCDAEALAILDHLREDTRVRVIRDDGPFNYSALNNGAAKEAKGDVVLLLNNDIDVVNPDWLKEMVSLLMQPDVGVVGAKLLYPDGRVQHAGVTFGPDQIIMHQMRLAEGNIPGPTGELALVRTVSAVTAACLALRRSTFEQIGGLNETAFKIAYNDIDLCRNVSRSGLKILWTPFAELFHFESVSRGPSWMNFEKIAREEFELYDFWKAHPELYDHSDPYHNPNIVFGWLDTHLAAPPRRLRPWLRRSSAEAEPQPFFY